MRPALCFGLESGRISWELAASRHTKMVKARAMALKTVVPGVLSSAKDREILKEDLRRIGCHGLMEKPWSL